jgi:hypothetical protein
MYAFFVPLSVLCCAYTYMHIHTHTHTHTQTHTQTHTHTHAHTYTHRHTHTHTHTHTHIHTHTQTDVLHQSLPRRRNPCSEVIVCVCVCACVCVYVCVCASVWFLFLHLVLLPLHDSTTPEHFVDTILTPYEYHVQIPSRVAVSLYHDPPDSCTAGPMQSLVMTL